MLFFDLKDDRDEIAAWSLISNHSPNSALEHLVRLPKRRTSPQRTVGYATRSARQASQKTKSLILEKKRSSEKKGARASQADLRARARLGVIFSTASEMSSALKVGGNK